MIDASKIDADLTDFPVMILLNSTNMDWTHVQDDLDDLRFIDSTETIQLYAELENYTVNNKAWIWVNIPLIDDAIDTDFYIYYGNSGASSWWSPEDVWDSSAVMVQHMYDNPDTSHIIDSTSYSNDGTKKGANEPIETGGGKIDSALSFDGSNDYIELTDSTTIKPGTGDFSVFAWIKLSDVTNYRSIIVDNNFAGEGYYIRTDQDNGILVVYIRCSNNEVKIYVDDANQNLGDNMFHHVGFTWNNLADSLKLYIDGEVLIPVKWQDDVLTGDDCSNANKVRIGLATNNFYPYKGLIDEVRIYNRALSAAEIKADYNSEANTLLIYGAESNVPYALTVRYNIGINKLYVNGTQRANNTTIYIPFGSNVNATAVSQSNFIFSKHILGTTETSFTPEYTFSMIKPYVLWSYALPNFYIYEEPTTFTFSQWMMLLFLALGISLLAAIKFHIIATVSLILVLYMIINVASYTGMILLAIIVWLLTIMFSIIAFGEI
jgi:hypothetical protein